MTVLETLALFRGRHDEDTTTVPWDTETVGSNRNVTQALRYVDPWTRLAVLEDCRQWISTITEHPVSADFLAVLIRRELARRRRPPMSGC